MQTRGHVDQRKQSHLAGTARRRHFVDRDPDRQSRPIDRSHVLDGSVIALPVEGRAVDAHGNAIGGTMTRASTAGSIQTHRPSWN